MRKPDLTPAAVIRLYSEPAGSHFVAADCREQVAVHTHAAQPSLAYSSVPFRYSETAPILVEGPASGRHYQFLGSSPVQAVDVRDIAAVLRTPLL